MIVDKAGFDAAMEQQKARGRAAWIGSGEKASEKRFGLNLPKG